MKYCILLVLAFIATSQAFDPLQNINSCSSKFIQFVSKQNNLNQYQKIVEVFEACGVNSFIDPSLVSERCFDDLQQGLALLKNIYNQKNNKIQRALNFALLIKLYNFNIKKSCTFFDELHLSLASSGVCLESAYQLSLTVQTLWQHLTQGKVPEAFKDLQKFLDDVPNTLDACGDHTLAERIRKDFPAACLKSFEDLGKQLIVVEHNFDHWEWIAKHWKDVQKVLGQVKTTCPLFA